MRGALVAVVVVACSAPKTAAPPDREVAPVPRVVAKDAPTSTEAPATKEGEPNAEQAVVLPIPDREQHPKAPPSGWCGETAIQQALLHVGAWVPQKRIHDVGKSKHEDLYADEIPVALATLGVKTTRYGAKTKGFAAYETWVKNAIDEGDPVLAGVKIFPTEHPTWGLDHFVLVVGYGARGLLVNTTWGYRVWASDADEEGISFRNAFYAIRIRGLELPKGALPARVDVQKETGSQIELLVSCGGLTNGETVRIERRKSVWESKASWSTAVVVEQGRGKAQVVVDASASAIFWCRR